MSKELTVEQKVDKLGELGVALCNLSSPDLLSSAIDRAGELEQKNTGVERPIDMAEKRIISSLLAQRASRMASKRYGEYPGVQQASGALALAEISDRPSKASVLLQLCLKAAS